MNSSSKTFFKGCFFIAGIILIFTILNLPVFFAEEAAGKVQVYTYKIINSYNHDKSAFTQGLVFEEPFLYEGTGFYYYSSLRKIKLETGEVLKIRKLENDYYGEGVTIYKDKIIQLTWKTNTGFIYDKNSFELLGKFSYLTEGWGITHNGKYLIMSDGSNILYFLDPETFKETGKIEVFDGNKPVYKLNELEYINGEIYANVWKTDKIVIINPGTGKVTGWVNLEGLFEQNSSEDVLNGIAYDAGKNRLFVTGKLKPNVFEIQLVPPAD